MVLSFKSLFFRQVKSERLRETVDSASLSSVSQNTNYPLDSDEEYRIQLSETIKFDSLLVIYEFRCELYRFSTQVLEYKTVRYKWMLRKLNKDTTRRVFDSLKKVFMKTAFSLRWLICSRSVLFLKNPSATTFYPHRVQQLKLSKRVISSRIGWQSDPCRGPEYYFCE